MFGIAVILGGLGFLMVLERIFPNRELAKVDGWWLRVLFINFCQLLMVVGSAHTFEKWFQEFPTVFSLKDHVSPPVGGFITYLVSTWLFYWWHLLRHEIYLLWLAFHQLHHSAQRIETITSFYKHPLEIFVDSLFMIGLLYPLLGLTAESSIWLNGFAAFGEYFYHMNIKTPRWMGYFFQRPESHQIHHFRNKRFCYNYSDFPVWDMLGGTFFNPRDRDIPTGFEPENETRFTDILFFKDVLATSGSSANNNAAKKVRRKTKAPAIFTLNNIIICALLSLGCLQTVGYLTNMPKVRGLGLITVASPLPLVFSAYQGVETFSTTFTLDITHRPVDYYHHGDSKLEHITLPMTRDLYNQIKAPYNLRNVYGVVFSHGPFFNTPELLKIRQHLLDYMVCKKGLVFEQYAALNITALDVTVRSNTVGNENKSWTMSITCP